ncbi:MAG: hypothetical protein AB7L66_12960 [Gemmatimonadales bacterium]
MRPVLEPVMMLGTTLILGAGLVTVAVGLLRGAGATVRTGLWLTGCALASGAVLWLAGTVLVPVVMPGSGGRVLGLVACVGALAGGCGLSQGDRRTREPRLPPDR